MKKIRIREMSNKNKSIVIVGIVTILVLSVGGRTVYRSINQGDDPLTSKLKVVDAVSKNGVLKAPYNISKENYEKVIYEDEYLSKYYEINGSTSEQIANMDNRNTFKVERNYSLSGIDKETFNTERNYVLTGIDKEDINIDLGGLGRGRGFYSNIKTYDNFNNPSALSLSYRYVEDAELADIIKSGEGIVAKLFNEEISKDIFSNKSKTYTKTIKSASGDYELNILKGTQEIAGSKELTVLIQFDKTEQESYDLNSFKYTSDVEPLYNELQLFNGEELSNVPDKYSSIIGDYAESRLTLLLNNLSTTNGITKQSSGFTIRTVYDDNTATAVEYTITKSTDSDDNITEANLNVNTSIAYSSDPVSIMETGVRVVCGLLGDSLDGADIESTDSIKSLLGISDDELNSGKIEKDIEKNIAGYDFKIHILIKTETDEQGTFGIVEITGK